MATSLRDEKLKQLIRELAAEFFSRTSNRTSMITITNVETYARGSRARILVTVLPTEAEEGAVSFMHRQLSDFRDFVMEKSRIGRVPYFEVGLDKGEKSRQRLDDVSKNL